MEVVVLLSNLILFLVAVLPILFYGLFLYYKDKHKEPLSLLLELFLCGVGSTFLVYIFTFILCLVFPFFTISYDDLNLGELFIAVFVGIAFIEEISKYIFCYSVSFNHPEFDEFYDMILYCAFVSLGFACLENLLYVYNSGIFVGIMRSITAIPGHICDGIFMGYYLGLAKLSLLNGNKKLFCKNIFLSLFIPVMLHGIYDYLLFSGYVFFTFLFTFFIICLFIISFNKVNKISNLDSHF